MAEGTELDLGTPGGSARREHERRRERREANTHKPRSRIGKFLMGAQPKPIGETNWETGAAGEEMLAAHLAKTCPEVLVLHDRRIPGRRTNIDHIAVAPSGVFVIDAKRYTGKLEVRKPFLGDASLFIKGRNRTKLVEGLARQQEVVRSVLTETIPEMPVHACFCFLNPVGQAGGSGLPLIRTLSINDFPLFYPRKLSKRLNAAGALTAASQQEVASLLAIALPPA